MKHLCDSNVFLALVLESHPHHRCAKEWFDTFTDQDLAFLCRATQTSFLRLLTVKEWMKEDVRTNAEALTVCRILLKDPRVEFLLDEPADLEAHWFNLAGVTQAAPRRWMDAYLAGFARTAGMRMVTFDRGFEQFQKKGLDLLVLSEVPPKGRS